MNLSCFALTDRIPLESSLMRLSAIQSVDAPSEGSISTKILSGKPYSGQRYHVVPNSIRGCNDLHPI